MIFSIQNHFVQFNEK